MPRPPLGEESSDSALSTEYASKMYRLPNQSSYWTPDGTRKKFSVYIVSNTTMTLYTGVTNNLLRRVLAHKDGQGSKFTSRYHFDRLVYFETYELIADAIIREKHIKGLTRSKKINLIKAMNPTWCDLSVGFWW
jgi:putative endonuclease